MIIEEWQKIWTDYQGSSWTKSIIPDIRPWIRRKHGDLTYCLTQVISGHGCFYKYLMGVRRRETDECQYCKEVDDVQHVIFECERWTIKRKEMEIKLKNDVNTKNLIDLMIKEKENWTIITKFIEEVLNTKEMEDSRT